MNSEERRLLSEFLDQLTQIKGISKDPDAEALISQAIARQPDAHYLLVQKAMVQEQALNSAKARIDALQQQLEQARARPAPARSGGGFLSNDPWATPAAPRSAPAAGSAWAPPPVPQTGGGGLGSFLGTAAATAAGIAGGAFLFQGIENLLGHHDAGHGFFDTANNESERVENVTINEYYGNEPQETYQDTGFDQNNAGFDAYDENYDDDDGTISV